MIADIAFIIQIPNTSCTNTSNMTNEVEDEINDNDGFYDQIVQGGCVVGGWGRDFLYDFTYYSSVILLFSMTKKKRVAVMENAVSVVMMAVISSCSCGGTSMNPLLFLDEDVIIKSILESNAISLAMIEDRRHQKE